MGTHYSHLSQTDRVAIQLLLQAGCSRRQIADKLGFSPSTICREVIRGKLSPTALATSYRAAAAQSGSDERRAAAGAARRKLGANRKTFLWRTVLDGLRCRWSPEQIACRLREMKPAPLISSPSPAPLTVSHETIYAAIYAMPRGTLRSELIELLRQSHKTRLPRARGTERKARLPNMTSIALRPPEVAARIVPGHWEGDLIKGAMNRSSVGTLVERLSRYVMLVKLEGNTAEDILNGFRRRLRSIPESLRKTMTYDQGSEMAMHEKLSADLNMDIFFCDPHSPWQRGSNENANGLVREYLPKGMDLSSVSHQELTAIEASINGRPRKILNWHTPQEVFSMLTLDLVRGVALEA